MVQNEADSELGMALIKAAKQRGFTTINILPNKPGVSDSIELLKSIGGDVVVTEAYTNTWYELHSHSAFFPCNYSVSTHSNVVGIRLQITSVLIVLFLLHVPSVYV